MTRRPGWLFDSAGRPVPSAPRAIPDREHGAARSGLPQGSDLQPSPFVTDGDRAVALSAILTRAGAPLAAHPRPLHGFNAPTAGQRASPCWWISPA